MQVSEVAPPAARTHTVSVAMATYNGAAHVEEQLRSLASQTWLPAELVIGDDGSTDATCEIVQTFAETAPFPVRLQRNARNLGHIDNFLETASRCTSDFVAFCDQDDVWLPHKLERCLAILTGADPPSLVAHAAEAVDGSLVRLGYNDPDIKARTRYPPGHALPLRHFLGFALVFERSLLSLIPLHYRPRYDDPFQEVGHDHWVCFLSGLDNGLELLDEPLALYRQHGGNAVGAVRRDVRATLGDAIGGGSDAFIARAASLEECADLISRARAEGVLGTGARHAATWEAVHRDLAGCLRVRARLHCGRVGERASAAAWLVTHRAYRPMWRGGLGRRAALKDLLVLLTGGRLGAAALRRAAAQVRRPR
jgi:hypothetical protein